MTTVRVPTFADLYLLGRAEVERRNPALTDWNEGSTLDALVGAQAVLADELARVLIDLFAAQFVDTAEAAALDALALDRFGLRRKTATAARGTLSVGRGTATGLVAIPAGSVVSATVSGRTRRFVTTSDVDLASSAASVSVPAEGEETGPGWNVAAGTITTSVDLPTGLTVTNAAAFVGGAEAETDLAFRDRIRRYFATLRRGTVEALIAGAQNVGGVDFATVDESFIAAEDGGYVAVYVGDPDARANDLLVAQVASELDAWRSAGVWVRVFAAQREELSITLAFQVVRGSDTSTMLGAIRAAAVAYAATLPIGAPLRLGMLLRHCLGVSPDLLGGRCSSHAADPEPTQRYNAIRLVEAGVAITIAEV